MDGAAWLMAMRNSLPPRGMRRPLSKSPRGMSARDQQPREPAQLFTVVRALQAEGRPHAVPQQHRLRVGGTHRPFNLTTSLCPCRGRRCRV